MIKKNINRFLLFILSLSLLLGAGCTRKAKMQRRLSAAERAFASDNYSAAEIEFLNALRLDPTNRIAIRSLGQIYFAQEQYFKALPFLNTTKKEEPAFIENRARVSRVYLALGAVKDAVAEAQVVLQSDPTNETAILVLVESVANPQENKGTRQLIDKLRQKAGDKAIFHTAYGYLAQLDSDDKSAEVEFKKAIALDQRLAVAHFGLGNLYFKAKKNGDAEVELKTAAELSPDRSARRLRMVEYKLQMDEMESAKKLLSEIQSKVPDYLPAWIFSAKIALVENKFSQCDDAINRVISQNPGNYEALFLRAQLRRSEGKLDAAVAEFEKLNEHFPKVPAARYQLAVTYLLKKDTTRAAASLSQTVAMDANFIPAALLLADLDLHRGDAVSAIRSMTALVAKQPTIEKAHSILASAYVAVGKLNEAVAQYVGMLQAFPKSTEVPYLLGMTYRRQGKDTESRKAFEKALQLSPDNMSVIEQLAELDLRSKDYPAAIRRAEEQIAKNPKNSAAVFLLAKVYMAQNNRKEAEPILEKVIQMTPDAVGPYVLLAQIYVAEKKIDPALEKLRTALSKNPKDTSSLLLTAMIYSQKDDFEKAKDAYEQLLAINPNSLISLNNLANIYAEKLKQLDKAYGMARKAHELRPNDPAVADTFGWILTQRGDYISALAILRDSAQKLPADPEILSHVGITHYFLGQEDLARSALEQSLRLGATFNGRSEVEKDLAFLALNSANPDPKSGAALEERLAEKPGDPVAVSRFTSLLRQKGQGDRAISVYERGLVANPNSAIFMVRLAELLDEQKRESGKVMELLRSARQAAPDDIVVSRIAGRLAYNSNDLKDQQWALSLLQESKRKGNVDPESQYFLGLAYYSQGRMQEAQETLKSAVSAGDFSQAQTANQLLEFLPLLSDSSRAAQAQPAVDAALKRDPTYIPALAAKALALQRSGQSADAEKIWERILARYPGFAPAIRNLAIILAGQSPKDSKAILFATNARELFPQDAAVAKALGVVKYYQNDFQYAARLLTESARAIPADAQVHYFLGMSFFRLKKASEAKTSLKRALELQPNSSFSVEAKLVLGQLK